MEKQAATGVMLDEGGYLVEVMCGRRKVISSPGEGKKNLKENKGGKPIQFFRKGNPTLDASYNALFYWGKRKRRRFRKHQKEIPFKRIPTMHFVLFY